MPPELRWIRGAGRRPRYVGFGRAEQLFRGISDLSPVRGAVERLVLAARRGAGAPVDDERILAAWGRLHEAMPDASAAFLLYTGYYKDTILSGVVAGGELRFVKVFAAPDGNVDERSRLERLRSVVPDAVLLPELTSPAPGIAAYPLLHRESRRPTQAELEDVALTIGLTASRSDPGFHPDSQNAWDVYVAEAADLVTRTGLASLEHTRLPAQAPGATIAHGDFTPWNAFRTTGGRLALVDYERVGLRSPFTDSWHLATQAGALRSRARVPTELIARVSHKAGADPKEVRTWYDAYLLQDLHQDATDWVVHGRRHPQLRRLIRAKAVLLGDGARRSDR